MNVEFLLGKGFRNFENIKFSTVPIILKLRVKLSGKL